MVDHLVPDPVTGPGRGGHILEVTVKRGHLRLAIGGEVVRVGLGHHGVDGRPDADFRFGVRRGVPLGGIVASRGLDVLFQVYLLDELFLLEVRIRHIRFDLAQSAYSGNVGISAFDPLGLPDAVLPALSHSRGSDVSRFPSLEIDDVATGSGYADIEWAYHYCAFHSHCGLHVRQGARTPCLQVLGNRLVDAVLDDDLKLDIAFALSGSVAGGSVGEDELVGLGMDVAGRDQLHYASVTDVAAGQIAVIRVGVAHFKGRSSLGVKSRLDHHPAQRDNRAGRELDDSRGSPVVEVFEGKPYRARVKRPLVGISWISHFITSLQGRINGDDAEVFSRLVIDGMELRLQQPAHLANADARLVVVVELLLDPVRSAQVSQSQSLCTAQQDSLAIIGAALTPLLARSSAGRVIDVAMLVDRHAV